MSHTPSVERTGDSNIVQDVGGQSSSPIAGALLLASSLDLLGQMIVNLMSNFAAMGAKLADMKAANAQASQTAQDNYCRNGDANNDAQGAPAANTIDWFTANGDGGDGQADQFAIDQQQLQTIISQYQTPDNDLQPALTAYQNTIQGLPSQYSQLLSSMSAPITDGQSVVTQLLQKGI